MLQTLKFFALFLLLSFSLTFISSAALMILATPTSTHLKVLEVQNPNNLPIEFFDSFRSDDDFVFYEFGLNAAESLSLKRVTISEENQSNKKEFSVSLSKWNSAIIVPLENNLQQDKGVLIEGKHSLLTSETFRHDYQIKEAFLIAELSDEHALEAIYEFEEGLIKVKYLFSDKEVHAFWFFFWFVPIFSSIIFTVLFVLISHSSLTKP